MSTDCSTFRVPESVSFDVRSGCRPFRKMHGRGARSRLAESKEELIAVSLRAWAVSGSIHSAEVTVHDQHPGSDLWHASIVTRSRDRLFSAIGRQASHRAGTKSRRLRPVFVVARWRCALAVRRRSFAGLRRAATRLAPGRLGGFVAIVLWPLAANRGGKG